MAFNGMLRKLDYKYEEIMKRALKRIFVALSFEKTIFYLTGFLNFLRLKVLFFKMLLVQ